MVDNDAFLPCPIGLAYCRHLSTVRTHLSALVNHMIVSPDMPCDAGQGLTAVIWEQYLQDSTVSLGRAWAAEEWMLLCLLRNKCPSWWGLNITSLGHPYAH